MVSKKKTEMCAFCGRKIDLQKDRFVVLGTYEKDKTLEENFYHIQCWKDYWERKIQESIMKRAKIGMKGMVNMLNKIQGGGEGGDGDVLVTVK